MSTLSIPNNVQTLTTISSTAYNADTAAIEAWANGNIDDTNLLNLGITGSDKLKNASVTKAKMANDSVGAAQLEANSVIAGDIVADAVQSAALAFSAALSVALDYSGTGRVTGVIYENKGDSTLTLTSSRLTASTAPVDATEEISVVKLASSYTDPDTGGTPVVFTGNNPRLLTTEQKGSSVNAASDNTLAPGEAWVFNVISVGSTTPAGEVTLHIEVDRDT